MIKKDKFIKEIETLLNLQKSVVPLLNRHVSSSLFFSELKEEERSSMLVNFQRIAVKQAKHLEILNNIKEEALTKKTDVY